MRGTDETTGRCSATSISRSASRRGTRCGRCGRSSTRRLASLDTEFDELYAAKGRPSIAPERLIRASLIQILFSIRSERQLMEQMQYNLLFRWFVGLGIDDPVWVPTVFTQEPRPASDDGDVAQVPGRDPGAQRRRAAAVGRALLRRWHVDQGLGFDEEFAAEAGRHAARRRGPRRPARFGPG